MTEALRRVSSGTAALSNGEIVPTVIAAAAGLVVLHSDVFDSLLPVLPSTIRAAYFPASSIDPREIEVLGAG